MTRSALRAVCGLLALIAALAGLSLLIGAGEFGVRESLGFILGRADAAHHADLALTIETLRLPRAVAAVLVGAALGLAGCLLQTVTRNPLAESGILGINAGAALAVVIGITFTGAESAAGMLGWAFVGALGACAAVLVLANLRAAASPLRLILAGVAIGATLNGITALLLLANQLSFDQYRFWVMGSLSGVRPSMVLSVLPAVLLALAVSLAVVRPLAALLLGDQAARSIGHRPLWVRLWVVLAVALASAAAVALAGPIAFVGLLAPHGARAITRFAVGSQLLLSALIGAALLLAADIAARVVIAPYETPASVIVALIGAPAMILLVRSNRIVALNGAGAA